MQRQHHRLRAPFRTALCTSLGVSLAGLFAAFAVGQSGGGDRHLATPTTDIWFLAYTDQGPPPPAALTPALLAKFMRIATAYESQDANLKFTFAQWLVLSGVTDVREFWCMMWLWWAYQNQAAID